MKKSKQAKPPSLLQRRSEDKKASRQKDAELLASGKMSPEEIQRKNSIFPKDFFKNASIRNFEKVFGR